MIVKTLRISVFINKKLTGAQRSAIDSALKVDPPGNPPLCKLISIRFLFFAVIPRVERTVETPPMLFSITVIGKATIF